MSFFPTSVPTTLELLQAKNNISVLLSAGINDVITTLPVVDTTNLPASGYVTAEDGSNEVIQYTGKTATSLTGCTRGADSTTASAHGNGQALGMWGNAAYHNVLRDEVIAIAQNLSDRIGLSSTQIRVSFPNVAPVSATHTLLFIPGPGYNEVIRFSGQSGPNDMMFWLPASTSELRFSYTDGATVTDIFTVEQTRLRSNVPYRGADGSVGTPSYSFNGATDMGMYRAGASLIFSTGAVARFFVDSAGNFVFSNTIGSLTNGSASLPTYTWDGDTNTGIYRPGADQLAIATGGVARLSVDTATMQFNVQAQSADGSAATPPYSFSSDPDTGIYSHSANVLGFSTGGVMRVTIGTDGAIASNRTGGAGLTLNNPSTDDTERNEIITSGPGIASHIQSMYTTTSLTTAKTIGKSNNYCDMFLVAGASNVATFFGDLILTGYVTTTINVISSSGAATVRTYSKSASSENVQVALAANTWSINTWKFEATSR